MLKKVEGDLTMDKISFGVFNDLNEKRAKTKKQLKELQQKGYITRLSQDNLLKSFEANKR